MARDNKINMPSSSAGLTRYFDNFESKIMIGPEATVFIILAICLVVLLVTGSLF